jgi:hypothetical protein
MRILTFLAWASIVAGAIGMAAGNHFHIAKGAHLGLFLIGAGLAMGGLESLVTRRVSLRWSPESGEHHAGAPAVIWGLMALLTGAAVMAAAYLMQGGLWRTTLSLAARNPGLLFSSGGALLAGFAVLLLVQPERRAGVWRRVFVRYPRSLAGAALLLAGIAVVSLGVWEWIDPRGFDRYFHSAHEIDVRSARAIWRRWVGGL